MAAEAVDPEVDTKYRFGKVEKSSSSIGSTLTRPEWYRGQFSKNNGVGADNKNGFFKVDAAVADQQRLSGKGRAKEYPTLVRFPWKESVRNRYNIGV
ncbi:MAG: hypothetical protein R2751_18145 [Bacteroidales bacterium]